MAQAAWLLGRTPYCSVPRGWWLSRRATIYYEGNSVKVGGLISYASDQDDDHRVMGRYAGRIPKGEKPADIPVMQATKTILAINLKTAKTLGITVPAPLLARADEVIE
jgi:putative ABC transport system substrate-binding protein